MPTVRKRSELALTKPTVMQSAGYATVGLRQAALHKLAMRAPVAVALHLTG